MSLLPYDPRNPEDAAAWPAMESGDLFRLSGPVGREAANARDDVIRAQILLNHAGNYDLDRLGGPTGWAGGELVRGLRDYQRRKGLTVDGLMLPDGETMAALQEDLSDLLGRYNAPTTAEVDEHHNRLAREREDDDRKVQTRPAIVMPGESAPAYVQRVVSDVGDDQAPSLLPGAQIAQVLPINPVMPPPVGARPAHTSPEIDKAAKSLGQKVDDAINLLTLPAQAQRYLSDGTPPVLSSIIVDPAIEAASKTPPLEPEGDLPKTPPSVTQKDVTEIEEFIREEGKPWIEGYSTLDQRFIRDLMIQEINRHGPLGKPETRQTDFRIAKMLTDTLNTEYPELKDLVDHLGGSYYLGNPNAERGLLKQVHVKNEAGFNYPDITFGHPNDDAIRGHINSVSGRLVSIVEDPEARTPDDPQHFQLSKWEKASYQALLSRLNGVAQTIPKTWQLKDDALWEQYARTACRMVLDGLKTQLHEKGYLQSTDERPALPPPGKE